MQTDEYGKRQRDTDDWVSTQRTLGHDEKFQLFSAMGKCIFFSRSNISHLGETRHLCFCSQWPCPKLVCTKNSIWAPCFLWPPVTGASKSTMSTLNGGLSYLFSWTPGFDDLCCQSEAGRVFNTFVHLAETTPWREGEKIKWSLWSPFILESLVTWDQESVFYVSMTHQKLIFLHTLYCRTVCVLKSVISLNLSWAVSPLWRRGLTRSD